MNPLSSYAAMGGDSGCKYIIGEDYFATIDRNDGSFVSVTNPNMDIATSGLDGLQNMIEVSNWEWKEFPYTDEEWAALYTPQGFGGISNISEIFDEMLYQPLTAGKFLLKMDNSLWLVELAANQQMGTYLWSIYSLVPESAMGVAQWEYAPMLSSRSPYFRFEFDMDYTEISAVCTQSLLVDRDASGTPSDTSLIIKDGNALYWSPIDKDGNVVTAAIIHFSVHQGDIAPYSGATVMMISRSRCSAAILMKRRRYRHTPHLPMTAEIFASKQRLVSVSLSLSIRILTGLMAAAPCPTSRSTNRCTHGSIEI